MHFSAAWACIGIAFKSNERHVSPMHKQCCVVDMTRTPLVGRTDTAVVRVQPNEWMRLDLQRRALVFEHIPCLPPKPFRVPKHDPPTYREKVVKVLTEAVKQVHIDVRTIFIDGVLIPSHLRPNLNSPIWEVYMNEIEAALVVGRCPVKEG